MILNFMEKIRAIVTGATGMVGEGVLHECLLHPDVELVLIITRRPSGYSHPKLKEIIHSDFYDLSTIENQLSGYNACFFCLGVSSLGMKEEEYRRVTYDLTMHMAQTLVKLNHDMTFCYISGAGTDSTEKGRLNWARVKGKNRKRSDEAPVQSGLCFSAGFFESNRRPKIHASLLQVLRLALSNS